MLYKQIISHLILTGFAVISFATAAAEPQDIAISKSISFTSSTKAEIQQREVLLNQADVEFPQSPTVQGNRIESTDIALLTGIVSYHSSGDVTVYDASTELISDFNLDGFYHRFSITMDIDTIYDVAYVYAQLYLSLEGGPWIHYATSMNYHIYGDSELDSFVVETELADGFPPGYYDVRIEVYNADNDEWLASSGPYDDYSLSALPLEDSYYDSNQDYYYPVETGVVIAGHGHGSMSWWLLIITPVLVLLRRKHHTGYSSIQS